MSALEIVVLLNCITALLMTGIIWFVQFVHYPLFQAVGQSDFPAYERAHTRRTGYVVAPLMMTELCASLTILFMDLPPALAGIVWVNAAMVALIWLVTFTVQVPIHRRLTVAPDRDLIDKLVRSNIVRVFLWTARAAVALLLLVRTST